MESLSSGKGPTRDMTVYEQPPVGLERRLGAFDATMIIVGNIIGMGIFTTAGLVAEALPHPQLVMAAWAIGGGLTLCGALTYAELGAALPRAGGEYVYLREAYGPFWGFLNGWTYFLVSNPGSIAVMCVALTAYVESYIPAVSMRNSFFSLPLPFGRLGISSGQLFAVAVIILFSGINYLGVRAGSLVQNVLTMIKLAVIIAFAGFGFFSSRGSWAHFAAPSSSHYATDFLGALSLAMISVFFSYTGWFTSTYVASEIRDPERNIPRSIILGTLAVMLIYLLINAAYLYALPVAQMKGVINIGEAASAVLFGERVSRFVSAAIIISVLGAINSVILTAPRIYFTMAQDGLFFGMVAKVHPVFKTPANSILLQGIWACVLVLSGTFAGLLTYTTVAMLGFSIMTGLALLVLRRSRAGLSRPFRVPGYPWIPLVFVFSYSLILLNIVVSKPRDALAGLAIVALGVPAYAVWKRWVPLRSRTL
jgi:APA family basic amino acid/polyamine antiporter